MTMQRSMTAPSWLLALSVVVGMLVSGQALAAAGKVVYATGDVQVERAGKMQPLAKGAEIESGDTIITGTNGRVQLRMADGDHMALRTSTRFKVDEFKAPTAKDKPETGRSFYSLVSGGFRALTKSLGRRGNDSYRVRTPVATIGIRGTVYWVIQYAGDANNPPGLYFGVSEGGLNVSNNAGELDFGSGQFGYVKDANSLPVMLSGPPSFMQGTGNNGNGNNNDDGGGYSGGVPLQGCTNSMAGDVNCPPTQPIQGDGIDFTPGELPPEPEPIFEPEPEPPHEPPEVIDETPPTETGPPPTTEIDSTSDF